MFEELSALSDDDTLELSEDLKTHRAFWVAVLQFATADGADAAYFRSAQGEDCLAVYVDNQRYLMMAPPAEYRTILLQVAKRLAVGRRWAILRPLVSRLRLSIPLGAIDLETPFGIATWFVFSMREGLRFERTASARCTAGQASSGTPGPPSPEA
jgi:hypothetical protein